jgi:hypothetical protein
MVTEEEANAKQLLSAGEGLVSDDGEALRPRGAYSYAIADWAAVRSLAARNRTVDHTNGERIVRVPSFEGPAKRHVTAQTISRGPP